MVTVYLAHPGLIKEKGLNVQKILEKTGIKVINPFEAIEQDLLMGEIVERELSVIDNNVDAVVVIVDDVWTIGTTMEAFHAWEMEIPVFVLWLSEHIELSWYSYIATGIYDNVESLIEGMQDE